jgi:arginyl-tRNA synthetase
MKSLLQQLLQMILKDMGVTDLVPEVSISDDPAHGEYTTNVAMKVAKSLKKSPMEIALQVAEQVKSEKLKVKSGVLDQKISKQYQKISNKRQTLDVLQAIDRVEVAPPGFLNVFLTEASLSNQIPQVLKDGESYGTSQSGSGKQLMVEYTDPNPFKEFHIGHLYSNAVGESLARLYEAVGWKVVRADYFGDVGMHVAKSIWGLKKKMKEDAISLTDLKKKSLRDRVKYLGQAYSVGASIYEEKTSEAERAKEEMKDINYMVYLAAQEYMQKALKWKPQVDYKQYVKANDLYQEVKMLFEAGRTWSMDYFETIFRRLGTRFDEYYPESIVGEYGAKLVREHLGTVFEESDGAVVFRGEHTRVFLNSLGLPTYEAKELGLNWKKNQDYRLDKSYIVTGNEINEYFKVVLAAMSQVVPEAAVKTRHIGHGMVRLPEGKMSSRTGMILSGEWLLDEVKRSIYKILDKSISSSSPQSPLSPQEKDEIAEKAAIAAIKYSMLRVALPANIAFDFATSLSFDGDSGPYLLYSYARCKSVLRKASSQTELDLSHLSDLGDLSTLRYNPEEKNLARAIFFFPEIVAEAAASLSPNLLCSYLFKLAQAFNLFYQKWPILPSSSPNSPSTPSSLTRLALTAATAQVLKNGLNLLGIQTVERM